MWWYYVGMMVLAAGNLYFTWRGYRLLQYHLRRIDEAACDATRK